MIPQRECCRYMLMKIAMSVTILFCVNANRDKKTTRGYSSGKRLFKLSAGTKKKPRRHNTEVSKTSMSGHKVCLYYFHLMVVAKMGILRHRRQKIYLLCLYVCACFC